MPVSATGRAAVLVALVAGCDLRSADLTFVHGGQCAISNEPCPRGQVNDWTLGRPCARSSECWDHGAPSVDWVCPIDLDARLRTYCTRICAADADCGPEGRCLDSLSIEGGRVRTCWPVGCEPPPCDAAEADAGGGAAG